MHEWFPDESRLLVRVNIQSGAIVFRGDATWLDTVSPQNAQNRARHYWQDDVTSKPRPEIIVYGQLYFPDWTEWARLMSP